MSRILVLITTTYRDEANDGSVSVSTALVPAATWDEAQTICQSVWDQRSGGNAAPNGISHDALMLGDKAAAEAHESEQVSALRAQVEALEALRPHWAQGYTSDGVAAQTCFGALNQLWSLLGATDQTEAVQRLTKLVQPRPVNRHDLRSRLARHYYGARADMDGLVECVREMLLERSE